MSRREQRVDASTTRRQFLRTGAVAALALTGSTRKSVAGTPATSRSLRLGQAKLRPDLLDQSTGKELEITQLTTDPDVAGSHIYMEAQIFTPDSKRFVLQRSGHAHGSDRKDPRHQFLLCDIEDRLSLHPLTDETGTTGPAVSPDGKSFYYFVDQTAPGGGRLILKRTKLDGTDRQTLLVLDGLLPDTRFRPSHIYPFSTVSSDGKRLAISAYLYEGQATPAAYGLMVFDLQRPAVQLVIHGPDWINMHPQFCRSTDPELKRDILIQQNHGREMNARGEVVRLTGGAGADIHVIRDDGTSFRDLPWGRDGNEFCQGHQCWRGQTGWAITSTQMTKPSEARLIESRPVPPADHIGLRAPGGIRNDLSREFPNPQFYHFATDLAGRRLVSDAEPFGPAARICIARLGEPGRGPLTDLTCVARPRPTGQKTSHLHPFLSPNGRMAFFNSDETGRLQAYMVRGLPDPT